MPTDKEKQCNNECQSGWCCHWEFFTEPAARYDKEAVNLINMKEGRVFKHPNITSLVIVALPVKCRAHTPTGCALTVTRPVMCKEYPSVGHQNWVMSKHCVYFDKSKYWSFEDMKTYEPKE